MVRNAYNMALTFRHRVRSDKSIRKWFTIIDQVDLIPEEFRGAKVQSYRQVGLGEMEAWNEAWRSDEFVLDPTRVTLFIGRTGMNGFDFREKVLMERFGIQINKTSINSVLLIFTIGATWSSVHYLLDALRRIAATLDAEAASASDADRALRQRKIAEITEDLPALPDFSRFADVFRPAPESTFGDMRAAFYAGYESTDRDTCCSVRPGAGSLKGRRWSRRRSSCRIRRDSRFSFRDKRFPRTSCTSWRNSTSRRFTAITPNWGCRSSPSKR